MTEVILNGVPTPFSAGCTIEELVQKQNLGNRRIAVELNAEVVPRSRYAEVRLRPGDRIELVHAIGGG